MTEHGAWACHKRMRQYDKNLREAKKMVNDAKKSITKAKNLIEQKRILARNSLYQLGRLKATVWTDDMVFFVKIFGKYYSAPSKLNNNGSAMTSKSSDNFEELFAQIERSTSSIYEGYRSRINELDLGSFVSIASFGNSIFLNDASDEDTNAPSIRKLREKTPISWLSNYLGATEDEDWLILCGVEITQVTNSIVKKISMVDETKRGQAYIVKEEAKDAYAKLETPMVRLVYIQRIADAYHNYIAGFRTMLRSLLSEVKSIEEHWADPKNEKELSINSMPETIRSTFFLTRNIGHYLFEMLTTPLLNDECEILPIADEAMITAVQRYNHVRPIFDRIQNRPIK